MKILVKFILIFWGIVLGVIVIKSLINFLPKDFDFSFENNIATSSQPKQDNEIYLPLQKQYGFTLDNVQGCVQNYKSGIYQKGYNFDTSGQCWNDICKLTIQFQEKIPKTINLYIKHGSDCNLQKFNVPKVLNTIGYYVDLQLTDTQKQNLGISPGDKIQLKQANGYTIDSQHQLYFYTNKISEDTILINNNNKGKIYFSKGKVSNLLSKSIHIPDINIPHPKKLFTYTCDENRVCEKSANTYIINIDGIDFIPDESFIIGCVQNTSSSKYCKSMTTIGTIERPIFTSDAQMNRYIKDTNNNPEFNDSLKNWEKDRLKKAKEKIINSI